VGGVVSGVALVPAYHALDSAAVGVWNLGVNTIIVPVAGVGWNTVIGPPLALVGQKPAESRVDGFWVTIVGAGEAAPVRALSQEEVAALGQWGLLLLKETEPVAGKRADFEKQAAQKEAGIHRALQALRVDLEKQRTELRKEESALIQRVAATNELALAASGQPLSLTPGREDEAAIRSYLRERNLSAGDVERTLLLLRACQAIRPVSLSPSRQKTDPLQRSAEIVTDAALDTFK
jgi:hypothetical protein